MIEITQSVYLMKMKPRMNKYKIWVKNVIKLNDQAKIDGKDPIIKINWSDKNFIHDEKSGELYCFYFENGEYVDYMVRTESHKQHILTVFSNQVFEVTVG